LLGAEGRTGILTAAVLQLLPRPSAEAAGARVALGWTDAVAAASEVSRESGAPAELRWDRAQGTVEARFVGSDAAGRARRFGSAPLRGHRVEGLLELAGDWSAWAASTPLRPAAARFVALHPHGAFAAVAFDDADELERAARTAQHLGLVVVSPGRLRASPEAAWHSAGRGVHRALSAALDGEGVLEGSSARHASGSGATAGSFVWGSAPPGLSGGGISRVCRRFHCVPSEARNPVSHSRTCPRGAARHGIRDDINRCRAG